MSRGVTLVGVIWGAFHFPYDRYSDLSSVQILVALFFRVGGCVAMGFVLSWVTLRTGSILPATLAHAVSNMLLEMGFFQGLLLAQPMHIVMWTLLALMLYRYWPPKVARTAVPPSMGMQSQLLEAVKRYNGESG